MIRVLNPSKLRQNLLGEKTMCCLFYLQGEKNYALSILSTRRKIDALSVLSIERKSDTMPGLSTGRKSDTAIFDFFSKHSFGSKLFISTFFEYQNKDQKMTHWLTFRTKK